jgi:hypothetical protein
VAALRRLLPFSLPAGLRTWFYGFGYIVQMLLYTLPNLGIAFQYFNLVELKEAKGLMDKIDSMGSVASSEKGEEHY